MKLTTYALLSAIALTAACKSGEAVSSATFGDEWPLTVDSGRIDCIAPNAAVFIHDGTTYQLNGMAQSRGYARIDPIWRDAPDIHVGDGQPDIPGGKVNIGPLLRAALALC